jgi:hypothetical protein
MTAHRIARYLSLWFVLFSGCMGSAQALTTGELQRLLQSAPAVDIPFVEQRQSPWLPEVLESRGIVRSLPQGGLEKQVESPKQEIWRLLPDRMEWRSLAPPAGTGGNTGNASNTSKQILFSKAPALGVLSDAIRHVVAGDFPALERDFKVVVQGDAKQWTAHLQPQSTEAIRYLDRLEMQGSGSRLLTLVVVERKGERTTTRFYP